METTKRETLSKLSEAHVRHDHKLKAGMTAEEMRRWITIRKGLRAMMEPLATSLQK